MTTLIVARHGNTFNKGETPTRVGALTDLPLIESGIEQAAAIGRYIKENRHLTPDVVYSSNLQRTIDTARIAVKASGVMNPVYPLDMFNEINYGPDENKPEAEVIARLGAEALQKWDEEAVVPDGWLADPKQIIKNWIDFADQIAAHDDNETVLVVTSNGIARFAPHITGDFEAFKKHYDIKLATGALGIFKLKDGRWSVDGWNIRPPIG